MPADLVPNEAIPKLAKEIDSPAMLTMLRHLEQNGFILNNNDVNQETAAVLRRLTELGLVDPGYDGPTVGKPFIWVKNGNGHQVLQYFEGTFKPVVIHPRARPALASLSERDRQTVLGLAEYLRSVDPASWPRELVVPLSSEKPMYLMRVTPELRAFITTLDSGGIELSDIVREESLRLFLEREHDAATHQ